MEQKAKIKEIFTSIQGEGPYIGVKQLFIRFCGCNLHCSYCDTNYEEESYPDAETIEFSASELKKHLEDFGLKTIHSISLTGGEPLLWWDFLTEFIPMLENKIYLETNATLHHELKKVIELIDYISADIKLSSATAIENSFALHDEFFKTAKAYGKEIFAKIVFDENILDSEIENCLKLADKYNLMLVLQPKMAENKLSISNEKMLEVYEKFTQKHPNTRLIPQVHKFLQVI